MRPKHNRNRGRGEPAAPPEEQSLALPRLLDIPATALGSMCQMELAGNREAIIDGCQGILEYDENVIRLAVGKMSVKFTGRGLQIKVLTHNSAVVEGYIANIEFIT